MRRLLLTLMLVGALPAEGAVIDHIAATIDRDVITLTEVEQVVAARIIQRSAGETEEAYRRRALDTLIAQALRYRDVIRFGAEDVTRDSVEARLLEIQARFASPEAFLEVLERIELPLENLRSLITRQLQVNAYIEERFSPLVFVSIEEIETYYSTTWLPQRLSRGLPRVPLGEVREEIRALLKAERLDAEIARWTAQLRARANVDIYVYR
ncbi:MAG TPA: hypothetical protein VMT00_12975 [Thermoanaerobaculia bacterium]|nr:hypothetical protein [Thermoanaerobaculia bacterium]